MKPKNGNQTMQVKTQSKQFEMGKFTNKNRNKLVESLWEDYQFSELQKEIKTQ